MSVPPDSPWRGAASAYAQPLDAHELSGVQALVEHVYYMNCGPLANPRLGNIEYRSSENDGDIRMRLFRWDTTHYRTVFVNGFVARREENTPETTYFNLYHFVHHAGRPLESTRPATHVFISTTLSSGWRPSPNLQEGQSMRVYRYEINAPGGILVSETLDDLYQYTAQDEVSFVVAIAPQYIRSAQLYVITRDFGSRYTRCERANDTLILNANFNPQSHPYRPLQLRTPVVVTEDEATGLKKLKTLLIYPRQPNQEREKREVLDDWYATRVEHIPIYINAAFRAHSTNEAYLFMNNEYVLVDYAPGSTDDKIINGPLMICGGFKSLVATAFGEHGIECAFDTDGTKAFIFSGKLCAYIDYAPGSTDDKILQGPMTITAMFPFFKRTVFENSIDSAFRVTASNEAYLFKGDQYAHINYNSKTAIEGRPISERFNCLRGTIFESGIEAAFASHRSNEAYIFKEDRYALFNFADDNLIGGVKKIVDHWPSLRPILPRRNRGLDQHDHIEQDNRDQDIDVLRN